jgi:hypothetical protein
MPYYWIPQEKVMLTKLWVAAVAQLVEALHYKPEGHGFNSRVFHWRNPFGRTMALWSTQPLTEISTRNISWGVNTSNVYGWQHTTFNCRLCRNLGASTSWNPKGLSRSAMGLLYLTKLWTSNFVMLLPLSVVDICFVVYEMNTQFGLHLKFVVSLKKLSISIWKKDVGSV